MAQLKCTCCNGDFEQNKMVTCGICKKPFSYACVKLTQSEAKAINNTNKNLSWTCEKCLPLGEDIASLKQVVINLQKEIADFKNLKVNNKLEDFQFEEIIHEIQEREKRKHNLIIYGVKEEPNQNSEERLTQEHLHITDMFSAVSVDSDVTKLTRLGAYDPSKRSPRPLKITLRKEEDVHKMIKKARTIKGIERYKHINISLDRTPKQIELYKKVKTELDSRKNDGEENIRIKYVKGIPQIVPSLN